MVNDAISNEWVMSNYQLLTYYCILALLLTVPLLLLRQLLLSLFLLLRLISQYLLKDDNYRGNYDNEDDSYNYDAKIQERMMEIMKTVNIYNNNDNKDSDGNDNDNQS